MGKEQTIGMENRQVNGVMYELPVPVCEWLQLMEDKCEARQILLDKAECLALSQESEIRDYEKRIVKLEREKELQQITIKSIWRKQALQEQKAMSDKLEDIRERHEEHQADIEFTEHEVQGMRNDPDVDFEVVYCGEDEAHKDRGELLKTVEQLQAQLDAYNIKGVHNCPVCGVNYAYWQNRAAELQSQVDRIRKLDIYDYDGSGMYKDGNGCWLSHYEVMAAINND